MYLGLPKISDCAFGKKLLDLQHPKVRAYEIEDRLGSDGPQFHPSGLDSPRRAITLVRLNLKPYFYVSPRRRTLFV